MWVCGCKKKERQKKRGGGEVTGGFEKRAVCLRRRAIADNGWMGGREREGRTWQRGSPYFVVRRSFLSFFGWCVGASCPPLAFFVCASSCRGCGDVGWRVEPHIHASLSLLLGLRVGMALPLRPSGWPWPSKGPNTHHQTRLSLWHHPDHEGQPACLLLHSKPTAPPNHPPTPPNHSFPPSHPTHLIRSFAAHSSIPPTHPPHNNRVYPCPPSAASQPRTRLLLRLRKAKIPPSNLVYKWQAAAAAR